MTSWRHGCCLGPCLVWRILLDIYEVFDYYILFSHALVSDEISMLEMKQSLVFDEVTRRVTHMLDIVVLYL